MQDTKEASMSHVDEGMLHAYLDGELPSGEGSALEAHLAQCEACRARRDEERALLARASTLLGAVRPVERPAPPFEEIRRPPKRSPWRVRMPIAWAASVVLALGFGYYLAGDVGAYGRAAPAAAPFTVARDERVADKTSVATNETRTAPPALAAHPPSARQEEAQRQPR